MNSNDSTDLEKQKTELELERIRLEQMKLELQIKKIEQDANLVQPTKPKRSKLPENTRTIVYLSGILPPIGLYMLWKEPKIPLLGKLLVTIWGLTMFALILALIVFEILPWFH